MLKSFVCVFECVYTCFHIFQTRVLYVYVFICRIKVAFLKLWWSLEVTATFMDLQTWEDTELWSGKRLGHWKYERFTQVSLLLLFYILFSSLSFFFLWAQIYIVSFWGLGVFVVDSIACLVQNHHCGVFWMSKFGRFVLQRIKVIIKLSE